MDILLQHKIHAQELSFAASYTILEDTYAFLYATCYATLVVTACKILSKMKLILSTWLEPCDVWLVYSRHSRG